MSHLTGASHTVRLDRDAARAACDGLYVSLWSVIDGPAALENDRADIEELNRLLGTYTPLFEQLEWGAASRDVTVTGDEKVLRDVAAILLEGEYDDPDATATKNRVGASILDQLEATR